MEVVQTAINLMPGKDEEEKVERFVSIVNAGLITDAQVSMQARLNKSLNSEKYQVAKSFADIVKLTETMFPDLDDTERGQTVLERFPEIAKQLEASGLKLALGDDTETAEDNDEE